MEKKRNDIFIIIDGNSLINRAFYAVQRPMITREGIYTQGIYGFLNMLFKIEKDYAPGNIAVAFDMKGPTFRHKAYAEYKAGRKTMPVELAMQIPILKDILRAMNIPFFEKEGFEADDIIGSLSSYSDEKGIKSIIVSGDKDQLQLVSDNTRVLFTKRGVSHFDMYDKESMIDVYGFDADAFIDLKALMGDKSDNIPGVAGVGEKTATKLIREYGSIDNIYENIDDIKPEGLKQKLKAHKLQAFMSKELATINCNVPLDKGFLENPLKSPDYEALIKIYEKLEFRSFLKKIDRTEAVFSSAVNEKKRKKKEFKGITDSNRTGELVKILEKAAEQSQPVGLCVHGNSDHIKKPVLESLNICVNECVYEVCGEAVTDILTAMEKLELLYVGYGLKNDFYMLMSCGFKDNAQNTHVLFDLEIADYLISGGARTKDFTQLVLHYLRREIGEDICEFFDMVFEIMKLQQAEIESLKLEKLLHNVELPLIRVMAQMEYNGFSLDRALLEKMGVNLKEKIKEISEEIYKAAGEEFNISSPKQLGIILFEKLGLTKVKKTKTGYSTGAEVLEKIRHEHGIIDMILQYRAFTKINSTYVEGLAPLIGDDSKIHASFNQTVTSTGRISSSNPNMQNIPIRQEIGRQIREAFVPSEKGNLLLGGDYSQIELRVLVHMSEDEGLLESFNRGEDIHRATASRVLGLKPEEITPLQRSKAKAINFGVIYGMSGFGLSEELHITRKEADMYIKDYFSKHKKVKEFMDKSIEICKTSGYVTTIMGRRRYISEIKANAFTVRQLGERLAMNTPIQGSAADIIKIAMVKMAAVLDSMKSRLLLQVHDELIVEAVPEEIDEVERLMKTTMEGAIKLNTELVVDIHRGVNWRELK